MKVLQINTVCGRGSTGRIATDLLKCLQDQKEEGLIAYGYGKALNINPQDTIKIGTKLDYYLHNLLSRFTDKEGCYSKYATRILLKKIEKYNPDIIHLHNIHGHYINYKYLFDFINIKQIPVIWTLHDCWPFTGHCTYFSAVKCEQWMSGCQYCLQLSQYPQCYTKGKVKENFKNKYKTFSTVKNLTIVTPSIWLRELVKKSFLKKYPIRVINNGIDLEKFRVKNNIEKFKEKHRLNDKIVLLGVASEWSKRKGLDDYIKLAKILPKKYILILVGIDNKKAKELPKTILTIEKTNNVDELAEIYNSADVFINFTYEDNFPTVNLESIACGTPIITYRTGGSVEVINENTGVVIEQGEFQDVLKNIDTVLKINREKISQEAMKYDRKARYNDYIELYHEIIRK